VTEAAAALEDGDGVASRMRLAQRALERVSQFAGGRLDECLTALERAAIEVSEASAALQAAGHAIDLEPEKLEQAEERLFALRALARKHQVECDALPALRDDFAARLEAMGQMDVQLGALEQAAAEARKHYTEAAKALSAARRKAAKRLDAAVSAELGPLRLGGASFATEIVTGSEDDGGPEGIDRVAFLVATNPGSRPGPLARIASGGELSRFMLALKVALAGTRSAPTLVFDEADRGVGGSTADAVGERLAQLAETLQVLVITHSPQVAARGSSHWRVSKAAANGKKAVTTTVEALDERQRHEEVARMLAGAQVTEEARAAAKSLLTRGAA
jgi:DNA repair protein RecN (Recombination protein N)